MNGNGFAAVKKQVRQGNLADLLLYFGQYGAYAVCLFMPVLVLNQTKINR
jgi:hypothetical protein